MKIYVLYGYQHYAMSQFVPVGEYDISDPRVSTWHEYMVNNGHAVYVPEPVIEEPTEEPTPRRNRK